jgi:hypothetical protein
MPELEGIRIAAREEQVFIRLQRSLSDETRDAICWII